MRTVSDIIRDCGGAGKIAEASKRAITADAIRKWLSIGIPEKHWAVVMPLGDVTLEELYAANTKARKVSSRPAPKPRHKAEQAA